MDLAKEQPCHLLLGQHVESGWETGVLIVTKVITVKDFQLMVLFFPLAEAKDHLIKKCLKAMWHFITDENINVREIKQFDILEICKNEWKNNELIQPSGCSSFGPSKH